MFLYIVLVRHHIFYEECKQLAVLNMFSFKTIVNFFEIIAFDNRRTHTNRVFPAGLCPVIFRCHKISWFGRHLGLAGCVAHMASISCKIF